MILGKRAARRIAVPLAGNLDKAGRAEGLTCADTRAGQGRCETWQIQESHPVGSFQIAGCEWGELWRQTGEAD